MKKAIAVRAIALLGFNQLELASGIPGNIAVLSRPEHVVDLVNRFHQFLSVLRANFNLASRAELGCLPEGVVQIGELLKVLRLEVISPKNQQLILSNLSLLFLDCNVARKSVLVSGVTRLSFQVEKLLGHRNDCLSGNPSRRGVVHAAGAVAVCADRRSGKLSLELRKNLLQHGALRSVSFQQHSDVFARKAVTLAKCLTSVGA